MRIASCVIIYHPDVDLLLRNIGAWIDDVEVVIIYRNSSEEITFPETYRNKLVFLGNGENHYIAQALNECLDYCIQNSFDYLLTMDQDSLWEDFHSFIKEVEGCMQTDTVIYAPNVNHTLQTKNNIIEIESTITSGSLHNVELTKNIGGYKDYYKIYWVDGEFCYRARNMGCRIVALPHHNLQQQFGKDKRTKIGGFFCADYSPESYYFMFRNMIIMRREWKDNPSIKCVFYTLFLYLRSIVMGEKHKVKKLRSVFRGLWDGHSFRLPKTKI